MTTSTDNLIERLSLTLVPVKPLRPPVVRGLIWLAMVAVLAAWPVYSFAQLNVFMLRSADTRVATEIAATLLTGIVATIAAFHLSVPDRSPRWVYAPLPPLLLWLAASGLGCLQNGLGEADWKCSVFVAMASAPLLLLLFVFLRRARPIAPLPVALTGGLAVAAIAAFLLQFFHPFDVTVIDLAIHAMAVLAVLGAATLIGRRALR
jgi:hypothetical protein